MILVLISHDQKISYGLLSDKRGEFTFRMIQQKVNKTFLMCRWDAKYLKNSLGWILVNSPSKFSTGWNALGPRRETHIIFLLS